MPAMVVATGQAHRVGGSISSPFDQPLLTAVAVPPIGFMPSAAMPRLVNSGRTCFSETAEGRVQAVERHLHRVERVAATDLCPGGRPDPCGVKPTKAGLALLLRTVRGLRRRPPWRSQLGVVVETHTRGPATGRGGRSAAARQRLVDIFNGQVGAAARECKPLVMSTTLLAAALEPGRASPRRGRSSTPAVVEKGEAAIDRLVDEAEWPPPPF